MTARHVAPVYPTGHGAQGALRDRIVRATWEAGREIPEAIAHFRAIGDREAEIFLLGVAARNLLCAPIDWRTGRVWRTA